MRTSYNGWPAPGDAKSIGVNAKWEPIPGHRFPAGIKAGDVEVVFTYLILCLNHYVEGIDEEPPGPDDEWGFVDKMSANSKSLVSCHASGTAVDYNARKHPNGKSGTFTQAQEQAIAKILALLTCIDWRALTSHGGVATGTPDEMHWEIAQGHRGTPAEVKRIADWIRAHPFNPADQATRIPPEDHDMPYIARLNTATTYQGTSLGTGFCTYVAGLVRQDNPTPEFVAEAQANGRQIVNMGPHEFTRLLDSTTTDIHRLMGK